MRQGGIVIGAAASFLAAGLVQAGVLIHYGAAELTVFGTPSPPVQSSINVNWPGPLGPLTVSMPPVGSVNVTRLSLSDFTESGVRLTASGAARWSALVGFRFEVDQLSEAVLSGRLFGDMGLGLATTVAIEDVDAGVTLFASDAGGTTFGSGTITLQPGTEYSVVYLSNYGLSGGTGQGTLMDLVITVVPEPQAVATACVAGLLTTRRRRWRPEVVF
jgi:hypothetical protein